MGRRSSVVLAVATGFVATVSCAAPMNEGRIVQEKYTAFVYCPPERVAVARRADLELEPSATAVALTPPRALPPPPPDIEADPGRLAVWIQRHQEERRAQRESEASRAETVRAFYRSIDLYEVTGCGPAMFYGCRWASVSGSRRRLWTRVCATLDDADMRWGSDAPQIFRRPEPPGAPPSAESSTATPPSTLSTIGVRPDPR